MWPTIERIRARATGMTTRGAMRPMEPPRRSCARSRALSEVGRSAVSSASVVAAARSSSMPMTRSTKPTVKSSPLGSARIAASRCAEGCGFWASVAVVSNHWFTSASARLSSSASSAAIEGESESEFGVSGAMVLVHAWTRGLGIVHSSEFRRQSSSDRPNGCQTGAMVETTVVTFGDIVDALDSAVIASAVPEHSSIGSVAMVGPP